MRCFNIERMGLIKSIASRLHKTLPSNKSAPAKPFIVSSYNKMEAWRDNPDLFTGLKFSAVMQLRTPLKVLLQHGATHTDINTDPPKVEELWYGQWFHITKTWRELGLDMDELPEGTIASEVGQVKSSDYLPFLIAVRTIVEKNTSIDNRINELDELDELFSSGKWQNFVSQHGGKEALISKLFPRFVDIIPGISKEVVKEFYKLNLLTANDIAHASDDELLSIKGVGKVKLIKVRECCAGVTEGRDSVRVENLRVTA